MRTEVRRIAALVAPRTMATSPLGVIFIGVAAWGRVPASMFLGWSMAFALTFLMHLEASLVNFRRANAGEPLLSRAVTGLTRVGAGIGWGMAAPMLDRGADDPTLRLMVLLVVSLVGVSGGIVIAEGAGAVAQFIGGLALPVIAFYLYDGDDLRAFIVFGTVATVGLTIGYGWIWNTNVYRATEAQLTANELAGRLESELRVTEESARRFRELSVVVGDLARRDELTGILNRRGLFEALRSLAEQHDRWFVALVDVDHFKHFNDSLGHAAGDEALRHLAEVVGSEIPPEAIFGRLGGEEFAVVVPVAALDEAVALGERLRASVEERQPGLGQPMTISIGVAGNVRRGSSDDVLDATMLAADEALYRAKADGRNCVRS